MIRNLMIEYLQDAVIAVDSQGIVLDLNPAMRRLFDLSAEAVGQPLRQVMGDHFSLFEAGLAVGSFHQQEITLSGDTPRYFELTMTPIEASGALAGRCFVLHDVSRHKRMEQDLRFQASLQDSVTDAVIVTDVSFIIQGWNRAAERIYGWTAEEAIGQYVSEVLKTEFSEKAVREQSIQQLRELGYWKGEVIQYHRDGSAVNILGSVVRFYDEQGGVVGVVAVNHDITARTYIQRVLAEECNLLRTLIDRIPEAIYVKDLEHRFILSNISHDHMQGEQGAVSRIGKTVFDLYPPEQAQRFHEDDEKVFHTGQPLLNYEEQVGFDEESLKWYLVSKIPLRNLDGEITGLVGITHDISERKAIEHELIQLAEDRDRLYQQSQRSLAEANTYAQKLSALSALSQQIGLVDSEQELFQITAAFVHRLFDTQELLIILSDPESDEITIEFGLGSGQQYAQGRPKFPRAGTLSGEVLASGRVKNIGDLAREPSVATARALQGGQQSVLLAPMLVNQRAVGVLIISSRQANAYHEQDENLLLHMASYIGITLENLRRSRQIQDAMYAAEAANRAKSEFLANMSHELRTPLNAILGYAQILSKNAATVEKQQEGLDIIYQSGDHLLHLINDILDLSKIEAHHMELHPAPFDLSKLLKSIADLTQVRASQKHLNFAFEPLTELPTGVYGDEVRLRQVLLNLLSNAVKYTFTGGVVFKVGLQDERLRFQIEDTGIGIAPSDLTRLFRPFSQVGQRNLYIEGTGLGLAISKQLVALMGGDLQVSSQPGEGSTFWFEIDLPETDDFIGEVQNNRFNIIGYQGERRRVMIIDDRLENRRVIHNVLEPLDFTLMEAVNGQDCLDKLEQFEPHIVFMDLRMPIMGGDETMRRIRRLPLRHQPVLIAISASAFDHDMQQSLKAGADAFLAKPFRVGHLLDLIAQHLRLQWITDQSGSEDEKTEPIIVPPEAKLALLHDLATQGDIRGIIVQCDHLEQTGYGAFAAQLSALAHAFKLKEIRQYIYDCRG